MTTETNVSQHADTLNALDEMQHSIAYAARRSVLADAERIIAEQEAELDRQQRENDELASQILVVSGLSSSDIAELEREVALLRTQLAEVQGRVIDWRKGGARGGEWPTFTPGCLYLLCGSRGQMSVLTASEHAIDNEDEAVWACEDMCDMSCWQWDHIEHWIPLSSLPTPKGE